MAHFWRKHLCQSHWDQDLVPRRNVCIWIFIILLAKWTILVLCFSPPWLWYLCWDGVSLCYQGWSSTCAQMILNLSNSWNGRCVSPCSAKCMSAGSVLLDIQLSEEVERNETGAFNAHMWPLVFTAHPLFFVGQKDVLFCLNDFLISLWDISSGVIMSNQAHDLHLLPVTAPPQLASVGLGTDPCFLSHDLETFTGIITARASICQVLIDLSWLHNSSLQFPTMVFRTTASSLLPQR